MRSVCGLASGCSWYVTRVRCPGATVGVQCPWARFGGASRPNVGVILSGEPTVIAVSSIEFPFVSHVSIAPYG